MSKSTVNNPPHYNAHPSGVECIVVAEGFGFNLGNVIKYIWRAEEKGRPIEDLEKARWYLNREIERRKSTTVEKSTIVDKQAEATAADNRVRSLAPVSRYCENCKKPMPVTHQTFKRDGNVIHVYHCDACGNDMDKQLCDIMHEEVKRQEAKATAAAVVLGEEPRCGGEVEYKNAPAPGWLSPYSTQFRCTKCGKEWERPGLFQGTPERCREAVLGERKRRYECQYCGTWYDQGEPNAENGWCCGHQLTDKTNG